jgi:hypothetical protein
MRPWNRHPPPPPRRGGAPSPGWAPAEASQRRCAGGEGRRARRGCRRRTRLDAGDRGSGHCRRRRRRSSRRLGMAVAPQAARCGPHFLPAFPHTGAGRTAAPTIATRERAPARSALPLPCQRRGDGRHLAPAVRERVAAVRAGWAKRAAMSRRALIRRAPAPGLAHPLTGPGHSSLDRVMVRRSR